MDSGNLHLTMKKLTFFHGFSEEHLRIIEGLARTFKVNKGTTIAHEGEKADKFYLILDGKIGVATHIEGNAVPVTALGPGNLFGWSWFISPYRWTFSAHAIEDSTLVEVDGHKLTEKCEQVPALGFQLMTKMAQVTAARLVETRKQLAVYYKKYKDNMKMW